MEWLSPMTALYTAAAAVPLLLLLYFLKLKRQEQIVSSTFLWSKAVRDLQVNAPFQRLRRNILLLLQLLILLVMLLALAWPVLSSLSGASRRYVLLIDRSASMNAVDSVTSTGGADTPSRLDYAKKQAGIFIESIRSRSLFSLNDDSDRVMVIAFDEHPKVMCNFTSDKRQALVAVDAITASHGRSLLAETISVARAFTQSPGTETDTLSAEKPPKMVLFSDGQISDLDQVAAGSDELTFHCAGRPGSNIAITAMQAKRSYEQPEDIEVFATVTNYDTQSQTCNLQLSVNNNVRSVRSLSLSPAEIDSKSHLTIPGKSAVNFTLSDSSDKSDIQAGVIELRQLQPDCLSCDDAAWAIVSAPKKLAILLVTRGNIVLETALKACSFATIEICSPEKFDAMDHTAMSVNQPYDVIVLDNHKPANMPKCRYLVFGMPPNGIDVSAPRRLEKQMILDWKSTHSVLKHVNLINLYCESCYEMILPRDAEILAEFNQTPALAIVRRNGSVFLLAGFDVLQTSWPFEPGFVMFCYNAANYLGMQVIQNRRCGLQVGEPIIVDGFEPKTMAVIDGPGFTGLQIQSNATGSFRFANTFLTGIYRLTIAEKTTGVFAVNLLDLQESNIKPNMTLALSGQEIQASQGQASLVNIPLWPYLVILVLILVCLEWLIYTFKIKI